MLAVNVLLSEMTKLSDSDLLHIADLSNLKLTKKEIVKFKIQLDKVINFVQTLNQVDTNNIKPTSQTTGLTNVFSKDLIDETKVLSASVATSGSNNTNNNLFEVPMILKERSDN